MKLKPEHNTKKLKIWYKSEINDHSRKDPVVVKKKLYRSWTIAQKRLNGR